MYSFCPNKYTADAAPFYNYEDDDDDNVGGADNLPTPTFPFCPALRSSQRKSRTTSHHNRTERCIGSNDYAQSSQSSSECHSPHSLSAIGGNAAAAASMNASDADATAAAAAATNNGRHGRPRLSIVTTESSFSEYSKTTVLTTTTTDGCGSGGGGGAIGRNSSIGDATPPAIDSPGREEMVLRGRGRRRHAINITSNPGYQVSESGRFVLSFVSANEAERHTNLV